jgi:hypothetical protein
MVGVRLSGEVGYADRIFVGHEDTALFGVVGERPLGGQRLDEGPMHQAPIRFIALGWRATVHHCVVVPNGAKLTELAKPYQQLKEPLKNMSLRYPKGIKERSDEAIFKYLIYSMKIASLRSCAL